MATATLIAGLWGSTAAIAPGQAQVDDRPPDGRAVKLFSEARKAAQGRDWEAAVALCSDALERAPNYVDAYDLRANALVRQGRHAEAINDYNIVLQLKPNRSTARFKRATAFMKVQQYEHAISDYTILLEAGQAAESHPRYCRSQAYQKIGKKREAAQDLEAEIDAFPDQLPPLGDLFMELGHHPYAARCYTLAILDRLNALPGVEATASRQTYWEEAAEQGPGYGLSRLVSGQAGRVRRRTWELKNDKHFFFRRDSDETRRLEQFRNQPPQGVDLSSIGQLYERRAQALFAAKQLREAICDLNAAIFYSSDPQTVAKWALAQLMEHRDGIIAGYYVNKRPLTDSLIPRSDGDSPPSDDPLRWEPAELSELIAALGKHTQGLASANEQRRQYAMLCLASDQAPLAGQALGILLDKESQDRPFLEFCAEGASRLNQHRAAVVASTQLLKLAVVHDRAYEMRAAAYQSLGEPQRAMADLAEVVRLVTADYQFIAGLRGALEAQDSARRVVDRMTAEIESSVQRGPANFARRADAYMVLGAYQEALKDYEMASRLAAPDGNYAREIGDCLLKLGDFARALQHYEEGLESGRSDGCRWGRARARAAMQQYEPAIADFEAALRGDPKNGAIYSGLALAFLRTAERQKALQVAQAGRALYDWDGMDVAIIAAVYAAHEQFDEASALQYKALEGAKTAQEAALQAQRLCGYWVRAYDGDALVAQLARLRKEAQHKRDLAERSERIAQEAARREAERERNSNPYLLHGQSGAEEEE